MIFTNIWTRRMFYIQPSDFEFAMLQKLLLFASIINVTDLLSSALCVVETLLHIILGCTIWDYNADRIKKVIYIITFGWLTLGSYICNVAPSSSNVFATWIAGLSLVSPVFFLNANPNMVIFLPLTVLNNDCTTLFVNLDFWYSFMSMTCCQ